jgi:hypothetical protein
MNEDFPNKGKQTLTNIDPPPQRLSNDSKKMAL